MPDRKTEMDDVKIICDTFSKYIGYYMTWFTWFFYVNIATIAVLTVYALDHEYVRKAFPAISLFFSINIIFGIISTVRMISYSSKCAARIDVIGLRLKAEDGYEIDAEVCLGRPLTNAALRLIFTTLSLTLAVWVFLALRVLGLINWPTIIFTS